MNFDLKDGSLRIYPVGAIDATTAPELEKTAEELMASQPHEKTVIDMKDVRYISSAGLRIILHLRKKDTTLAIENTAPEVYEIFDVTGFTDILPVSRAFREISLDGCEVIGEGSNGVVYRYNDELVVKLYRNPDALDDIRRERELARKALILGIPTAISFEVVRVGERYASVFELLKATSFSKLIARDPEHIDHYVRLFTDLILKLHNTEVSPSDMPSVKERTLDWVEFVKPHLPAEPWEKLKRLVAAVPDRFTMIHGDYHTNNVEMQGDEVLLIDMDTLSYGHPIFELATMYLSFVGYYDLDLSGSMRYLKLDYATIGYIWRRFLNYYLNTDDPKRLREVEEKAKLLGYLRLLRRALRRSSGTPEGEALIAHSKAQLLQLLETVDNLEF